MLSGWGLIGRIVCILHLIILSRCILMQLIKNGKAYVLIRPAKKFRVSWYAYKSGIESPFRGRSIEENLDLFGRMKIGEFGDGAKTLRAKIDMSHPNLTCETCVYKFFMHVI